MRVGKEKSRTKIIIIISAVILMIIGGAFAYGYTMLGKINQKKLSKSDADLGISSSAEQTNKDSGITNILFFGLDARDPDVASRSDAIMVVSIDKNNQKVKVSSLMRDMYVPIPGKGSNKINAAYAFGGPALAVKTINTDFNLDIRDYVSVNFFGLEKLVDKVGGVRINVSDAEAKVMNEEYISELNKLNGNKVPNVKGGLQTLDGRQAVAYCRIRYVGNADYERTERQRTVLNELFKKIKAQGVTMLPGTINTILPYVETSLSKTEILGLAMQAMGFNTSNIEQYRLPVDGHFKSEKIRGMSCLVPNIQENTGLLHQFIYGSK